MGISTKNKIFTIISSKKINFFAAIFVLLVFSAVPIVVSKQHKSFYVVAKFSESGPLHVNTLVYHKGYEIGKITNVWPDKDYKNTFIKMVLKKEPKLPDNITAKIKTFSVKRNYVDLIAEDETSTKILKKGSIITGEPAFDAESFISDIADSGLIVPLLEHFSDAASSLTQTSDETRKLISESRSTLKDNKQNLNQTTINLKSTTNSLNEMVKRINHSMSDKKITNTTTNIDKSTDNILTATENIKKITESIDGATKNLDSTRTKIDSTINNANSITCDVKVITSGLRQTLSKKFAGMKIMFGKPVGDCNCPQNCKK